MPSKGISLVGIRDRIRLEEIAARYPDLLFELSYAMTDEKLKEYLPLISGRIASMHSLCPRRDFFPNFASRDEEVLSWSEAEIMKDAELAHSVGASILVLHPGYLTPKLIPSRTAERAAFLEKEIQERFILRRRGSIAAEAYTSSPEYKNAFSLMMENIVRLSENLKRENIVLAIENLNPRAGYLLIRPEEMTELARLDVIHFTLDIGHMWVSSCLFGFDYLDAIRSVMETGKVVNIHIHSNPSRRGDVDYLEDSHDSLSSGVLPMKEVLGLVSSYSANMMLETLDITESDIRALCVH